MTTQTQADRLIWSADLQAYLTAFTFRATEILADAKTPGMLTADELHAVEESFGLLLQSTLNLISVLHSTNQINIGEIDG